MCLGTGDSVFVLSVPLILARVRFVVIVGLKEFTLKMKKTRQIFTVMLSFFIKVDQSIQVMLFRKLINFQNVVVIKKESILFLYKSAVYYIDIENQKVSYRPFYNLFFYKLKILHKYLNNALIKN